MRKHGAGVEGGASGGSREQLEGPVSYPSTTLRVVPLPTRFARRED